MYRVCILSSAVLLILGIY
ncbi:hypothetical protein EYZ11_011027 [Aspergillus tanneri]|uniref:Uncharacterized protein n=1 Tax=Aspergillus tanneri TaxID=1220188 RepID=A0A4S3J608_9EURO|nr:hypothetical protein EYZ11_011027 [Aspergillus tanneri]